MALNFWGFITLCRMYDIFNGIQSLNHIKGNLTWAWQRLNTNKPVFRLRSCRKNPAHAQSVNKVDSPRFTIWNHCNDCIGVKWNWPSPCPNIGIYSHCVFPAQPGQLPIRVSVPLCTSLELKAHCTDEVKHEKREPTSWTHQAQLGWTARHCLHVLAPLVVHTFEPGAQEQQ